MMRMLDRSTAGWKKRDISNAIGYSFQDKGVFLRMWSTRLVAAALLLTSAGMAQISTARLEGTVQDSTGAVIPGAQVQALNLKTQTAADTKADAEGRFIFASLPRSD